MSKRGKQQNLTWFGDFVNVLMKSDTKTLKLTEILEELTAGFSSFNNQLE